MIGFAAMGMEIVWFRHLTILLGGFRAVFSLLLTVILIGIGAGSLLCAFIERRTARPAHWLMGVQGALRRDHASRDWRPLMSAAIDRAMSSSCLAAGLPAQAAQSGLARMLAELWFNARPMVLEVALPALADGVQFPACKCDRPARGAVRRSARRRAVSGKHAGRGLRQPGRGLRVPPARSESRAARRF